MSPGPAIIVGITGASGAAYGVRLLERLAELRAETHLVVTPSGVINAHHELGLSRDDLAAKATHAWPVGDIGACIASGSFGAQAMVVAPCSMKSLAAIAHGFGDNLLTAAAAELLPCITKPTCWSSADLSIANVSSFLPLLSNRSNSNGRAPPGNFTPPRALTRSTAISRLR